MRARYLPFPLLFVVSLGAQNVASFDARVRIAESVVERFYRGEPLEAARNRVNARVDEFNDRVNRWNARLSQARAEADRGAAELAPLEKRIADLDAGLAHRPDPAKSDEVRRYNQRLEERNALVVHYNSRVAQAKASAEAFESMAEQSRRELQLDREGLQREQGVLTERVAALEAFLGHGKDLTFYRDLNGLLADLARARRSRPAPELDQCLQRVRVLRRELGQWAIARQAEQENGLTVVEVLLGDEPCWLIVDTGAQQVCVSQELIEAAGFGALLGKEAPLVLAGGQKIQGRRIEIPVLSVKGFTERSVAGSAVPASEVGIDGLLGQSFLRRFVFTLDSRGPGLLILVPR